MSRTPAPPILTTELTLQIERHVAPAELQRFGSAAVRKSRGPWPPSAVYGFGAADVARLPEILAFLGESEPHFYVSHAGFDAAVAQALDAAGYYMAEWQQAVLYGVPESRPSVLPTGVTIELVTPETAAEAASVAAEGNEWPEAWRESAKQGVRESVRRPSFWLYLARYKGEPAGIADLALAPDGFCSLGGAAVPPRFRKLGLHTALIAFRLHEAFGKGAPLVVGCANFGSASFRNQQRLGLRLAYVEATWRKRR